MEKTFESYYARVDATELQLFNEGIEDDIIGKPVKVIKHYLTGYARIEGVDKHPYLGTVNFWDIPMRYLVKL